MWRLYDDLIEGIDESRRVDYACCGGWRAWVESDGRGGLASLLVPGGTVSPPTGELVQYRGKKLRDLAALIKSWDARESALGAAAINAYYNDISKLKTCGARLYPMGSLEGDAFRQLLSSAKGRKVATVGHFNGVGELYRPICDFTVFEKEPQEGDLPEETEEKLLPEMDLIFITGMAFTNKTLPRLLQLTADGQVVIVGPSLPLSDVLFDYGADILSGLAVYDVEVGRAAALGEAWRRIYDCSCRVMWQR